MMIKDMQNKKSTIHLMVGFIGFGKTTIARRLSEELSAKCFTHDDLMVERYGRNPDNFQEKYKIVDDFIKGEVAKCIQNNQDVILDYGFWNHVKRKEYYDWAKTLTDNVLFHVVLCEIDVAKQRVLKRTQENPDALFIDENIFDTLSKQYESWSDKDKFPVVFHKTK